jgi:hypothetical protein
MQQCVDILDLRETLQDAFKTLTGGDAGNCHALRHGTAPPFDAAPTSAATDCRRGRVSCQFDSRRRQDRFGKFT